MKIAAFVAASALLFATPAVAEPPISGSVEMFATPSILCDTKSELESIVDSFETSVAAGKSRFAELFNTKNARDEPACALVSLRLAMTIETTDLGRLNLAGKDVYGWVIHIANEAGEGYYLYLESFTDAIRNTI